MAHRDGATFVTKSDVIRAFTLMLFDVFAIYEAFTVSYILRADSSKPLAHHVSATEFETFAIVMAPLWILVFAVCGLYAPRLENRRFSEFARVIVAVGGGVMTLIVVDYLRPNDPLFPSRAVPVLAIGLGIVFVTAGRTVVSFTTHWCFARGMGLHNVILVGTGEVAAQLALELTRKGQGYRIVGVVGNRHSPTGSEIHGTVYDSLEAAFERAHRRVDEVLIADVTMDRARVAAMISFANRHGLGVRFVPDQFGAYASTSRFSIVGDTPVLELRLTSMGGWGAVGKRAFDLSGSIFLIFILLPTMLVVALLVKITDPAGPVFYRQARLGRFGQPIRVLKFRSMLWEYSTGPGRPYKTAQEAFAAMGRLELVDEFTRDHKVEHDPRISRIGRLLRRTSLDELPQLFNVLAGTLSLVGPRPITESELDYYGERQSSFLALKPGITGLWQVSGRSTVTYPERVKMDVFYVENWSPRLDAEILLKTVVTVTARKGAY